MKAFKKSKTSKAIIFNKAKIAAIQRKHTNSLEKLENSIIFISNYIKQNLQESIIKKEKQNTHNLKNGNIHKDFEIDMNIFDFATIKYILNKPKRSADELLIIKTYLSTMSFLSTIKSPIGNDKLLFSLSIYLKSEKKSKNTILFRFGNKGNKFYIILEGEVSILILKERKEMISFKRYFLHLLLLKMLKEEELVKKTIIANSKMKYHFDDKDFDKYYEKIAKFANTYFDKNGVLLDKDEDAEGEHESLKQNEEDIVDTEKNNNISNQKLSSKSKKVLSLNDKNNENLNKDNKRNSINRKNNLLKNNNSNNNIKNEKNDINNTNNENINDKNLISKKLNEKEAHNLRLRNKRKTERKKKVNSKFLFKQKEINYSHVDLPYFEIHEIKEIILYYIYLREGIEARRKNISIENYIKYTYLDSPFHRPLASEQYSKKELLIIYQYFEIIRKKAGESFGELALQREDNKRTGTALIATDCVLGYLSRTDYNAYLGEIETKKRKNDINFVISFSIFDKMNKNVFENRYFNYFTRENYFQGQTIILQDHKVDKVFFIKEGQYEITTNLSISKIYNILQYKTKKNIDDSKRIKIKCQNFNMRLYICYNKDILGLDDCCFKDNVSFITAKCITSTGCAFTIEKSILNEIKIKIPEIEGKINIIKEKREQVVIDRLKNIYNRIVQSKNKEKKLEKIKYKEKKKNDTIKYINYLFGLNKNKKNNEFKTLSSRTNKNRIQSAISIKNKKMDIENFYRENMNNNINNIDNNSIYMSDNNLSNKYRTMDSNRKNFSNSSKTIYFLKNNDKSNLIDNIKYNKEIKNILPRNLSQNFFVSNKIILENNNEIKNNPEEENKSVIINKQDDKLNNNIPSLLENRISEIMSNKKGIYIPKDKQLILKISKKLNRISNRHTQKKFINLYNPINEIISNEYSNLFNWLDTHESEKNPEKNKNIHNMSAIVNKNLLKSKFSSKFYLINKNNKIINKRPLSSTVPKKISFQQNQNEMPNIIPFSYDDKKENLEPKISLYNKNILTGQINKNYNKKIISQIISGNINPQNIKKDLNLEKYLKKILGTRYRNHYISYEEGKLVKLIDQVNLQEQIFNKGKGNKFKKKISSESNDDLKSNRTINTGIKYNRNLLQVI